MEENKTPIEENITPDTEAILPVVTQEETPAEEQSLKRNLRKTRVGVVSSDKMDKTITVKVERRFRHPIYGKSMARTKKYVAHDANNECGAGDTVRIMETRPLSKTKRWRLVEIIEKAK